MTQETLHDNMILIRSGGRRISLYAELGGYFSPDGQLNERAFRAALHAKAAEAKANTEATGWLSDYLEDVLGYLEAKGMAKVTLRLFEIAMELAPSLGEARVSLSATRMAKLLSMAGAREKTKSKSRVDDKARRILEAALEVFSKQGFHAAKMDDIAALSGVAKGTLYRHFKSKEDLLERLLSETSKEVVAELSSVFTGRGDVLEEIQSFIERWVGFIEDNHTLYRLIQTEAFVVPADGQRKMFYEYLVSNLPMIKEHFAAMNIHGALKTTTFYTVVYGILGFIDGVAHRWFRAGMDYSLRDEIPIISEVLFNGFVGGDATRRVFFSPPDQAATSTLIEPEGHKEESE